jgi:hypothetical protein
MLLEADKTWDKAERSGMCPNCSHFFDPGRESQVAFLAQTPEIRAEVRRNRARMIFLGFGIAMACLIPLIILRAFNRISFGLFGGFLYGLLQILLGMIHGPKRAARSALAAPSDIWKFSAP